MGVQRQNLEATRALVQYTKDLAEYTLYLVWAAIAVGILQGVLLWKQAHYTGRAANAANLAVRLAHRPYFDVKELRVEDNMVKEWTINDPRQPHFRLSVSYRVYNASQTPATLTFIGKSYTIWKSKPLPSTSTREERYRMSQTGHDSSVESAGQNVQTAISPGRGYRYAIMDREELSPEDIERYTSTPGLLLSVQYDLRFLDPFKDEHSQTIKRVVDCSGSKSYLSDMTPADETQDED